MERLSNILKKKISTVFTRSNNVCLQTFFFYAMQKENIEVEQAQVEEVNKKEDWMALYEKVAAARGEM